MLPANPLQHLLMQETQRPLVDDLRQPQRQTILPSVIDRRWNSSQRSLTVFCSITATSCSGWTIPVLDQDGGHAASGAWIRAGCHHVTRRF